ncbi:hypothetical protein FSP39_007597 [Pinctada imbricata]|uniref:protein-histidine N-methyltransferase n=1 Tax=Pinctada imbricata TaxID=66713 RepID=A0AA88XZL5_PINIB|nr:hypothetical protein FSP39_007597 [Pinctada imbricata]
MSFKFNFSVSDEDNSVKDIIDDKDSEDTGSSAPFVTIDPSMVNIQHSEGVSIKSYKFSQDVEVHCYDSASLEKKVKDTTAIGKALTSNSDLIPSVYEGGMTVWECGVDLAQYTVDSDISFTDKRILELGCGAGIPGICAAKLGASEVHFQDFNADVLELYTIPNVLNLNQTTNCRFKFFAGDWSEMSTAVKGNRSQEFLYDYILTAETIYSVDSYKKLHDCFAAMLKPSGLVYVAAKSNYFGVGGGTRSFEQFVKEKNTFEIKVVNEISSGVPREIMKLHFK